MFDHVKFGASDYAASKAFFLKALEPLGVAVVSEGSPTYGVELSAKGEASLILYQTEGKPAPLHLAFRAENRRQVDAFYRAAMAAGGKDNGAPGLCPEYNADYYAAFVIGPDGHNVEAVCHEPDALSRRPSLILFSLDHIGMTTSDEGNTILRILRERCGKWTVAELHDGRCCRVFDIAWGRDISAEFDHIMTNISPGPGGDPIIDFFHTSDVALLRDEETGTILFGHATRTI